MEHRRFPPRCPPDYAPFPELAAGVCSSDFEKERTPGVAEERGLATSSTIRGGVRPQTRSWPDSVARFRWPKPRPQHIPTGVSGTSKWNASTRNQLAYGPAIGQQIESREAADNSQSANRGPLGSAPPPVQ